MKRITATVPEEIHAKLKFACESRGMSITDWVLIKAVGTITRFGDQYPEAWDMMKAIDEAKATAKIELAAKYPKLFEEID